MTVQIDLDQRVLVELRGLVADRLPVLEDRVEHHAEHADEDDDADQQDVVVQVDLADCATSVTGSWNHSVAGGVFWASAAAATSRSAAAGEEAGRDAASLGDCEPCLTSSAPFKSSMRVAMPAALARRRQAPQRFRHFDAPPGRQRLAEFHRLAGEPQRQPRLVREAALANSTCSHRRLNSRLCMRPATALLDDHPVADHASAAPSRAPGAR